MKMMKWALLGGAALAVTATAARADDLSALKAQIEALQNRVSQLEAQPQAAMPSGYSLMALRDGQGVYDGILPERNGDRVREESGFTISVMPSADVAPVAEVSVSGEIRTALIYTDADRGTSNNPNDIYNCSIAAGSAAALDDCAKTHDNLDVANRGRIFVKGKVDTAVGEVGGYFRLEASGGGNFSDYSESVKMNKAYGWWKFAPEWELMAGYNDNTGALQTSYDWLVSSIPIATVGPSNVNNEQFRLTFTSGPLAFGIGVEDPDATNTVLKDRDHNGYITSSEVITDGPDKSDLPNLQGYLMYSSDAFTAQVVGLVQDDRFGSNTDWAVGGGATLGLMEHVTLLAAAVVGQGTSSYANNVSPLTPDEDFWGASAGIIANLAEDTRLELGVGYEDYDNAGTALGINGGIFWDPVSQVTVGLGATYLDRNDTKSIQDTDFTKSGVCKSIDSGEYSSECGPGEVLVRVNNSDIKLEKEKDNDSLQVFFGTWLRFP